MIQGDIHSLVKCWRVRDKENKKNVYSIDKKEKEPFLKKTNLF